MPREHFASPVVNVPEYAEETVAEGAFTLILAMAKRLIPIDREMHASGWLWPSPAWLGSDIAEKDSWTGGGRTNRGRSLARMAGAGFRARVVGYDPDVPVERMRAAGVEKYDDLRDMLGRCDFVSVHCVLNSRTRHLIGKEEIGAMKRTAFLINVSRGAIVDEEAMVQALNAGSMAGAGLDVYAREPLKLTGHPLAELFDMPNVILLPASHILHPRSHGEIGAGNARTVHGDPGGGGRCW